jgi:TolA-binding protein
VSRADTFGEDLSARSRSGVASEAEEAALERELERDPTLFVAHLVGLDMDRATAVRVGDEALVARAADRALARVRASGLATPEKSIEVSAAPPRRKPRRVVAVLAAAALVCVTGMAAGMWAGVVPVRFFPLKATPHDEAVIRPAPHVSVPPTAAPQMAPPQTNDTEAAPEPADTSANEPATLSRGAARTRAAGETSAEALFKNANAARRDGNFGAAKRHYGELIARYPSSDEAGLARVSLGKLLLASGDPSDAEREFGQYLKGAHGQLAEEALVSRAESFQKMGRADAERRTWQTLLATYPNSVYAAEAKGRLAALGN